MERTLQGTIFNERRAEEGREEEERRRVEEPAEQIEEITEEEIRETIRKETGRRKLVTDNVKRAMSFVEKISKRDERRVEKIR